MKRLLLLQLILFPLTSYAQWGDHSPWEPVAPVEYAAIARESPSTVVATATNGYIYISNDFGTTWRRQCLDDTMQLGDVEFSDSLDGIVNSSSGIVYGTVYNSGGTIFLTQDGGVTWSRIHVPLDQIPTGTINHTIQKLAMPSRDTFYACDTYGLVWRTTDRGQDWIAKQADTNWLNGIYFLDSKTGFIMGRHGCFSKTTDAGETWNRQNIGAGDTTELYGMDFYNRQIALVYGFGYTYVTTDGGTDWLFRPTPVSAHNVLNSARWINDHQFYALSYPAYQVYNLMGIDSEMTFHLLDSIVYAGVTASVYSDTYGGVAVGNDGLIMRSQDGINWNAVSQYTGGGSLPIVFGDTWYNSGTMFERSTDSGLTWGASSYASTFEGGIAGSSPDVLRFSDSLHGIALYGAFPGSSVETSDGGLTWTNAGLSGTALTYVGFSGQNALGATQPSGKYGRIGDTIIIWRSTDGGYTFNSVGRIPMNPNSSPYPNEKPFKFQIQFASIVDENNAYVSVQMRDTGLNHDVLHEIPYNLLYYTADGGSSWSSVQSAPELPAYGAIYFRDKNNGFLGCDSNILFRTTNGGETWSELFIPMSTGPHYITAINFRDSLHGLLGTNDTPNVFSTSDGGTTWHDFHAPHSGSVNGFLFGPSNLAFADVGDVLYQATIPWSQEDVHVETGLNPFLYIRFYPSPAQDDFHAQLDGTYTAHGERLIVGLYDILGREVLDLSSLANNGNNGISSIFTANVSELPCGAYSLHYQLGSSSLTKGLIIIH
ncbi:MAG: hypothetical protein ACHQNE_01500 [Candidatus Kapaibacterium sp.]